jgi:hypothetical protein
MSIALGPKCDCKRKKSSPQITAKSVECRRTEDNCFKILTAPYCHVTKQRVKGGNNDINLVTAIGEQWLEEILLNPTCFPFLSSDRMLISDTLITMYLTATVRNQQQMSTNTYDLTLGCMPVVPDSCRFVSRLLLT